MERLLQAVDNVTFVAGPPEGTRAGGRREGSALTTGNPFFPGASALMARWSAGAALVCGSGVSGEALRGSDLDVLLVSPEVEEFEEQRLPGYAVAASPPVKVDLRITTAHGARWSHVMSPSGGMPSSRGVSAYC